MRRALSKHDLMVFQLGMDVVDVFTVSIMANVIDLPFTIHSTAMRKPSIKKLWLRERYKSRRGIRSPRAERAIRIEPTLQCQEELSFPNLWRPIHLRGNGPWRSQLERRLPGLQPEPRCLKLGFVSRKGCKVAPPSFSWPQALPFWKSMQGSAGGRRQLQLILPDQPESLEKASYAMNDLRYTSPTNQNSEAILGVLR